ncbi:hypothetical protein Pelo_19396 [Pelomyxa schiedti]|nr:hypothetical protein Pelo_19396 [Pelomyxa schiedti]
MMTGRVIALEMHNNRFMVQLHHHSCVLNVTASQYSRCSSPVAMLCVAPLVPTHSCPQCRSLIVTRHDKSS